MKNKKTILLLVVLFMIYSRTSKSITIIEPMITDQQKEASDVFEGSGTVVADIIIDKTKVANLSEEKGMKISFEIVNKEAKTHSDLVYSIELIEKKDGIIKSRKSKKVYHDDRITLRERETIKKEIIYHPPKYLSGNFELLIVLADFNGLNLAFNSPGDIFLESEGDAYIEIKEKTCYLEIKDALNNSTYSLAEGVSLKDNEQLILNCEIENHFDKSKILKPKIDTFERSLNGKKNDYDLNKNEFFELPSKGSQLFEFILPKIEKPQAYSSLVRLIDDDDNIISNEIEVHFVVSGASATIQNISLDKNYYKKNDDINLSLVLSGPAQNFSSSRSGLFFLDTLFIEINIRNSKRESCLIIKDEIATSYPMAEYREVSQVDCFDPVVSVVVKDEKGNVLAERD